MKRFFRNLVVSIGLSTALAGCIGGPTPPSRYYLLAAQPDLAAEHAMTAPKDLSLAVGPVSVPSYLERNQIVTRQTPYQLGLAEFDIWAEPLDENLTRVLVENLSRVLGTDHVLSFAEKRGAPVDYEVAIDVEALDATSGGDAELVARWTVTKGREHLFTRRSRLRAPLADDEYATLAAAMSRNAAELSIEIATEIERLAR